MADNGSNRGSSLSDIIDEFGKAVDVKEIPDGTQQETDRKKKEKAEEMVQSLTGTSEEDAADSKASEVVYNANINYTGQQSMFDDSAVIDYARYINRSGLPPEKWEHYLKGAGEGEFETNTSFGYGNIPTMYDQSLDPDTGLDMFNIIRWSERYGSLTMKAQDFAYCQNLDFYPNNRLITLRRFRGGAPDNLFNHTDKAGNYFRPISTMLTWSDPTADKFIEMNFNEEWEQTGKGIFSTLKKAVLGEDDSKDSLLNTVSDTVTALLGDSALPEGLRREDGVGFSERSPMGNPNLIKKAGVRKQSGEGISMNINFNLDFYYEMRYIPNIDPSIAFMDLMANAVRMGTSTSEFLYATKDLKKSDAIKHFMNNDINAAVESFTEDINKFKEKCTESFENLLNNASGDFSDILAEAVGDATGFLISRFKENMKAAVAVDTGMPSGIWHVTMGNPKLPVLSCGDLILNKSKLVVGNEFGYNGFPNSFKISYDLKNARERGRDEIERIFNTRGRIYTYKKYTDNPDYGL